MSNSFIGDQGGRRKKVLWSIAIILLLMGATIGALYLPQIFTAKEDDANTSTGTNTGTRPYNSSGSSAGRQSTVSSSEDDTDALPNDADSQMGMATGNDTQTQSNSDVNGGSGRGRSGVNANSTTVSRPADNNAGPSNGETSPPVPSLPGEPGLAGNHRIYRHNNYGRYLKVADFGADTTGANDSIQAINAAISAAQKEAELRGEPVSVQLNGNLKISEQIILGSANDNVKVLFGEGAGRTTLSFDWQQVGSFNWQTNRDNVNGDAGILLDGDAASGRTLAHFTLRYEHRQPTDFYRKGESYFGKINGIIVDDADNVTIDSMEVTGMNRAGIYFTSTTAIGGGWLDKLILGKIADDQLPTGNSNKIINSNLHHNRVAGALIAFQRDITVKNNDLARNGHEADGGTGYGVASSSGSFNKGVNYIGNRTDHNYRKGLDVHDGENIVIENNTINGDRIDGIAVYNRQFAMTRVKIHNNHITVDPDFRLEVDDGDYSGVVQYKGYSGIQIQTNEKFRDLRTVGPGKYIISENTIEGLELHSKTQYSYIYAIEFRNHEWYIDYDIDIIDNKIRGKSSRYMIAVINNTKHGSNPDPGPGSGNVNILDNDIAIDEIHYVGVPIKVQEYSHDGNLRGSINIKDNVTKIGAVSNGESEAIQILSNARTVDITGNTFENRSNLNTSFVDVFGYGATSKPVVNVSNNKLKTNLSTLYARWMNLGGLNPSDDATIYSRGNTHNDAPLPVLIMPKGEQARAVLIAPNIKEDDFENIKLLGSDAIERYIAGRGAAAFNTAAPEATLNTVGTRQDDVIIVASGADRVTPGLGGDTTIFVATDKKNAKLINQIIGFNKDEGDKIKLVAGGGQISNLKYSVATKRLTYDVTISGATYTETVAISFTSGTEPADEAEMLGLVTIL